MLLLSGPIVLLVAKEAVEHLGVGVGVLHLVYIGFAVFNHWDRCLVNEVLLRLSVFSKDLMSIGLGG